MRWIGLYRQFEETTKVFLSMLEKDFGDTFPSDLFPIGIYRYLRAFGDTITYAKTKQKLSNIKTIEEHLGQLVGIKGNASRVSASLVINNFLAHILRLANTCNFIQDNFDIAYNQLESFFLRKTLEYRCFSPLFGFEMDTDLLDFAPNLIIRRTDTFYYESLQRFYPEMYLMSCMIEYKDSFKKVIGSQNNIPRQNESPDAKAQKMFDSTCSALRLQHTGYVAHGGVWSLPVFWEPLYSSLRGIGMNYPTAMGMYHYVSDQHPTALSYYKTLMGFDYDNNPSFAMALRRFNSGHEKNRIDEKLIDYMISFEALLLHESNQELGYKLALRGAHAIGTSANKRKYYFDLLKSAYNERSNLVHGGNIRKEVKFGTGKISFQKLVSETEEALRDTILFFMGKLKRTTHDKIISALHKESLS